jgi:hypothetical protein
MLQHCRKAQRVAASLGQRACEHACGLLRLPGHVAGELLDEVLGLARQAEPQRLRVPEIIGAHGQLGEGPSTLLQPAAGHARALSYEQQKQPAAVAA